MTKQNLWIPVFSAVLALSGLNSVKARSNAVTFERLLREMADLNHLAEYPDPPFRAARFSSYDRVSPADSIPAWFADNDHGYFLDTLPEGLLMMDAKGPGAITHIWFAQPGDSLAFYFDDAPTPSWTVSVEDLCTEEHPEFRPFAAITARGRNLYFPLPYQKSCRVLYLGNVSDIYYHIDYRTYDPQASVVTFSPQQLTDNRSLIDSVAGLLSDSTRILEAAVSSSAKNHRVPPGATADILQVEGPQAFSELQITLPDTVRAKLLRQCLLEITFDNAAAPQVRVPLGDFFCGMPHRSSFWTLPTGISRTRVMTSRWVMPFKTSAALRLVNSGNEPLDCTIHATAEPYRFTDATMYFNARWRQDTPVLVSKPHYWILYMTDPPSDLPMLHITGKGVHVGTVLQLWNRESAWWGEGDDRIWIDTSSEPDLYGTGTEDYFGYAYSTTDSFSHAYHAQPHADGFSGNITNVRFHISDPQPFTTFFRFDMEIQTAYKPTELDFGRAVFFYALGSVVTDHDTITREDLFWRDSIPPTATQLASATTGRGTASLKVDAAHATLNYALTAGLFTNGIIRVYSGNGRVILQRHLTAPAGFFSVSTLPPGVYVAELTGGKIRQTARFVISK